MVGFTALLMSGSNTRKHCAEWKDPNGSFFPIQYEMLARALGFDKCANQMLAVQTRSARLDP